jgi:hypothetical protein
MAGPKFDNMLLVDSCGSFVECGPHCAVVELMLRTMPSTHIRRTTREAIVKRIEGFYNLFFGVCGSLPIGLRRLFNANLEKRGIRIALDELGLMASVGSQGSVLIFRQMGRESLREAFQLFFAAMEWWK